jgi:hypothetical protein
MIEDGKMIGGHSGGLSVLSSEFVEPASSVGHCAVHCNWCLDCLASFGLV